MPADAHWLADLPDHPACQVGPSEDGTTWLRVGLTSNSPVRWVTNWHSFTRRRRGGMKLLSVLPTAGSFLPFDLNRTFFIQPAGTLMSLQKFKLSPTKLGPRELR